MYTNLLLYIYIYIYFFFFLIIIIIKNYFYNNYSLYFLLLLIPCHSNCIVLLSSISFSSALFYFINSIYFILLVLFIYLFYTLLALL